MCVCVRDVCRSSRAPQAAQSTADFMDDEDGLLGGALRAKEDFDTFSAATLGRLGRVAQLAGESAGAGVLGHMPGEWTRV